MIPRKSITIKAAIIIFLLFAGSIFAKEKRELDLLPHDLKLVAEQAERNIRAMNLEVTDIELVHYINSIVRNLKQASESQLEPKIRIINSQEPNAYSLINGTILICVGLFSTIKNEDQLAFLLAHEIAHIECEHHIKRQYELHIRSRKIMQGQLATFIIFGVGLGNANRMIQRAMSGFSKRMEYQADSLALVWVDKAGYDTQRAKQLFANIQVRFDLDDIKLDTSYIQHPQLKDRLAYAERLASSLKRSSLREGISISEFNDLIIPSLVKTYRLQQKAQKHDQVIATCNLLDSLGVANINLSHIKAQAFLAKGGPAHLDSAHQLLTPILVKGDQEPTIYRDLGYVLFKSHNFAQASVYLQKYIDHTPNCTDKGFVTYYLRNMHE